MNTIERHRLLPGDELIGDPAVVVTQSVTIAAQAHHIWPWVAQIGQGRGGFYSYDFLENLVGCHIHSATRINADWQNIAVGDPVRLAPNVALIAAVVDADRVLVLRGGVPTRSGAMPFDFTWTFALEQQTPASTRLIVRERYAYLRWWAPMIVRPSVLISSVMTRRMLRGIRSRVEETAAAVRFLSSPESSWTTGAALYVGGGITYL